MFGFRQRKRRATTTSGGRYKRRKVFRKRRTNVARTIRSTALRLAETKYKEETGENSNLFHNGGAGPNFGQIEDLLNNINQGDAYNNRNGDHVIGRFLSFRLWLSNKNDRPNVMYRILLYKNVPLNQASGTTDLFYGTGNVMTRYVNTEKYTVVYDKIHYVNGGDYSLEPSATLRERSKYIKLNIPLKNRKIEWQRGSSSALKNDKDNWRLAIVPYDAFGSLVTDNIASFSFRYRFYFKDP